MKESKYFNGESGIYYQQNTDTLYHLVEVEPLSMINKTTKEITKAKRYDIYFDNKKYKKFLINHDSDLVFVGEL